MSHTSVTKDTIFVDHTSELVIRMETGQEKIQLVKVRLPGQHMYQHCQQQPNLWSGFAYESVNQIVYLSMATTVKEVNASRSQASDG